jgi:hypothetical protein
MLALPIPPRLWGTAGDGIGPVAHESQKTIFPMKSIKEKQNEISPQKLANQSLFNDTFTG